MKITDNYYVLMRLRHNSSVHRETEFIYSNDESYPDTLGTDIRYAMRFDKQAAKWFLEDYERREYNGEPSGFVPLHVTREYTF
jgi:hypothetical protein